MKAEILIDVPRWGPLESFVLDEEKLGDWMWMHAYAVGGKRRIEAYKHYETREYLYLDPKGKVVPRSEVNRLDRSIDDDDVRFGETRSEVANIRVTDNFVEAVGDGDLAALEGVLAYEYFLYVDAASGAMERGSDRFIDRLARREFGERPIRRWGGDHRIAMVEMHYIERGESRVSALLLETHLGRVASVTEYALALDRSPPSWWEHFGELWTMTLPDDPV